MDIRQLMIFCTVSEQKSFTKAAQVLDMSQPAVSHAIRRLEQEVGAPLFDRVSHRIYLTGGGEQFLIRARAALAAFEQVSSFGREPAGAPLRLGSNITVANGVLPELMAAFYQRWPAFAVRVQIDSAAHIRRQLNDHELDLALIEGEFTDSRLVKEPICDYEIAVLCAPDHALARKGRLSIAEFAAARLLLREPGSAIRDLLEGALLHQGVALDAQWVSVNSQALIRAAERGLGLTVLPVCLVEEQLKKGTLVRLELAGVHLTNRAYAVYGKNTHQSQGMRAFLQLLRENAAKRETAK